MKPFDAMRLRHVDAVATGYDAVVLALPGLWGYWKLDENPITSGSTTAVDETGTQNGTYAGGAWTVDPGLFLSSPSCPRFVRANSSKVDLPNLTLGVNQKFTLGGFLQSTAVGATPYGVLGGDDNGGNRRWQYRMLGGLIEFVTIDPAVTVTQSVASVNDGNPHLVVCVFDPTLAAGAGVVKHYVDGSVSGASSTAITITNGLALPAIGDRGSGVALDNFSGNLDNMFLCLDAISAADVTALWSARNAP